MCNFWQLDESCIRRSKHMVKVFPLRVLFPSLMCWSGRCCKGYDGTPWQNTPLDTVLADTADTITSCSRRNRCLCYSASCRAKALGVLLSVCSSHLGQTFVAQGALVRGGDNHRIIPVCVGHAASRVPAAGRQGVVDLSRQARSTIIGNVPSETDLSWRAPLHRRWHAVAAVTLRSIAGVDLLFVVWFL